MKLEILWFYAL